jgi:hypothetical protein
MNMSSLYFLFNIFRNIECGWLFQLNGDVTYAINRTGVASLTLGVNSLGHVNNPICWAIIPEKTEGKTTYRDTWRTVQEAAILAMNTYVVCRRGCDTCRMVSDLRDSARIHTLLNKKSFREAKQLTNLLARDMRTVIQETWTQDDTKRLLSLFLSLRNIYCRLFDRLRSSDRSARPGDNPGRLREL